MVKQFRRCNPNTGLWNPEPTSIGRVIGLNKHEITNFVKDYEDEFKKNNMSPVRVYNLDESWSNTVHKPAKMFAKMGKKQVEAVTSVE